MQLINALKLNRNIKRSVTNYIDDHALAEFFHNRLRIILNILIEISASN